MRIRFPKVWEYYVRQGKIIDRLYVVALIIDILLGIFLSQQLSSFDRLLLAGISWFSFCIIFYDKVFLSTLRKTNKDLFFKIMFSWFGKAMYQSYWYGPFLLVIAHLVFVVHFLLG